MVMKPPPFDTLIGSGGSADVFRLSEGRVLKLYREGLDPGVIDREHDGVRHAQEHGLPVARALATEEVGKRRGIVFEELSGEPLVGTSPWRIMRMRTLLRRFAAFHASIHACSGRGLIHAQHDIIRVRILGADVSRALRNIALDQLQALPRGDRFCHGDFHPGNTIVTGRGLAAIDWSNGSVGDPAGDVARTELLFRYSAYGRILRRLPWLRLVRHRGAKFYLDEYRRRASVTMSDIAAWRLPIAVAALVPGSSVHRPALIRAIEAMGHRV